MFLRQVAAQEYILEEACLDRLDWCQVGHLRGAVLPAAVVPRKTAFCFAAIGVAAAAAAVATALAAAAAVIAAVAAATTITGRCQHAFPYELALYRTSMVLTQPPGPKEKTAALRTGNPRGNGRPPHPMSRC